MDVVVSFTWAAAALVVTVSSTFGFGVGGEGFLPEAIPVSFRSLLFPDRFVVRSGVPARTTQCEYLDK